MSDQELKEGAFRARAHAYAPYSGFPVGAAVLAENGKIYTGCNVENASYGLSICAERSALLQMVGDGQLRVRAIAVVADTERPASPCGACRQFLAEFAGDDVRVILFNLKGDTLQTTVGALIPGAFRQQDLGSKG